MLPEGCKYCFKIPPVLGGQYTGKNMGTISLLELVRASGDVAQQVKDLPDGAKIRLAVI